MPRHHDTALTSGNSPNRQVSTFAFSDEKIFMHRGSTFLRCSARNLFGFLSGLMRNMPRSNSKHADDAEHGRRDTPPRRPGPAGRPVGNVSGHALQHLLRRRRAKVCLSVAPENRPSAATMSTPAVGRCQQAMPRPSTPLRQPSRFNFNPWFAERREETRPKLQSDREDEQNQAELAPRNPESPVRYSCEVPAIMPAKRTPVMQCRRL